MVITHSWTWLDLPFIEPFGEISGDIGRAIIRQQAGVVANTHLLHTPSQSIIAPAVERVLHDHGQAAMKDSHRSYRSASSA